MILISLTVSNCFDNVCFQIFILQLEGSMEWVLYSPDIVDKEDFNESDDAIGIHTLHPGDVLYIPKQTLYKSRIPTGMVAKY